MTTTNSLPPELDIKDTENFDKKRLDTAFGWLAAQIRALSGFKPDWQAAVDDLRTFGLQRINEAIVPAYDRVMKLASFGFLKADSATSVSLKVGDTRTLTIDNEAQRALFTPTEFVTLSRRSVPSEWAVGRVARYDGETGALAVEIVGCQVSTGAHDDWQITATAGTVEAALALLADTRAARDAALGLRGDTAALKDAALVAKTAAEKAANDANVAALLIKGGPVASINGETGNIRLDVTWIGGLADALALKADKVATDAALAARYIKSEIDTKLQLKADQISLEQLASNSVAALATKADKAETTNFLALKADKVATETSLTALNTALSGKRDTGNTLALGHWTITESGNNLDLRRDGSARFFLQDDGNINTPLFGYLNSYIDQKKQEAKDWAYNNCVLDGRLTGGSYVGMGGNIGNSWGEVITAIWVDPSGRQTAAQSRFMQFNKGGTFYTIGTW